MRWVVIQQGLGMRRFSIANVLFCLSLQGIPAAEAMIYDINLNPGDGNASYYGPCYCVSNAFYSPVYTFKPGDQVNFGTVEIFSFQSGPTPDGGPNQLPFFVEGSANVSFDPNVLPYLYPESYSFIDAPGPVTWQLGGTIPDGSNSIQVAFSGPFIYTAPAVPEPSTWAMLLIGFAAIGAARLRRLVL